ncbi:MAG: NADH-binding protein [Ilumatobacteraceae bacterium]|nr:NADH-binding protein [Ilumatobacteraceae bacterium]
MRVLVAGGTGFIGRRLVPVLRSAGHEVDVMTRHPDGEGEVFGDVGDPASLAGPLDAADAAYYLVHSLDRADFAEYDAAGATAFAKQASASGLRRVVYLGGLGDDGDQLSAHLRSRREVEEILSSAMPTVALRAGIVVGHQSTAWEVLCQLVERLPVMITPKWVNTRTQPIALDDVVAFLAAALDESIPPDHYDVGAPDDTSYREMMLTVAHEQQRRLYILPVPVLSPSLSSRWLGLVTDVDMETARNLVGSMTNTVVVNERRLEELAGHRPMPFLDAARAALAERRRRRDGAGNRS